MYYGAQIHCNMLSLTKTSLVISLNGYLVISLQNAEFQQLMIESSIKIANKIYDYLYLFWNKRSLFVPSSHISDKYCQNREQ